MSEAVAAWGKPKSIGYMGGGSYWHLRYGDCRLGFSDNRLVTIVVAAENLEDSRFDNGIRCDMTIAEIIAVLGDPRHRSHSGGNYKVGGRKNVSFRFKIDGQFPKGKKEWSTAKLWVVSINGEEWVDNGMPATPRNSDR